MQKAGRVGDSLRMCRRRDPAVFNLKIRVLNFLPFEWITNVGDEAEGKESGSEGGRE